MQRSVHALARCWLQARAANLAPNDEFAATFLHQALDPLTGAAMCQVMLQRNTQAAPRRAHLAHAAVVGLHALCCGLPALAMLAAGLSGAASGIALFSDAFGAVHQLLHTHELWILGLSAALVTLGAWLELNARRAHLGHGFPWLFGFSVLCFVINVGVILAHRAG
jgi:hypothetical protein